MLTILAWACGVYAVIWAITSVIVYIVYKACMPVPGIVGPVVAGLCWPILLGILIGLLCVWLYSKVDPYPANEIDDD